MHTARLVADHVRRVDATVAVELRSVEFTSLRVELDIVLAQYPKSILMDGSDVSSDGT